MINGQIFHWLFPKKCFGCGQSGSYLCSQCRCLIKPIRDSFCPVCGRATLGGWTHYRCRGKTSPEGLVAPFLYQPPLSSLIKGFKYQGITELADKLVELMVERLARSKILLYWQKNDFIFLPVPLFPLRQLWRGFNQTEVILTKLCRQLNLPYRDDLLFRSRWTGEQAQLSAKKRRENVAKSFRVRKWARIRGKNFVVFDDVWTTGSTLKECVAALKRKGAAKVWGLVLARR